MNMERKIARSRLSKAVVNNRHQTKNKFSLVAETFIFWGAGIGIGLLFVIVILPILIRFTANLKMKNSEKTVKAQIIQAPIVNIPEEYSNLPTLTISGYASAGLTLYLVQNGVKNAGTIVPENGEFASEVDLKEGENTFTFYLENTDGNQSNNSTDFSVTLDQETPTIELEAIANDITGRDNQNLTVNGTTEAKIEVYVNNRLTTSNDEGKFTSSVYLNEGENTLTIKAVDKAGNTNELVKKVNFKL